MVNGCDGPSQPDAQEHVDSVGPGHVPHGAVSVLVTDGRHFAGEGVCGGRIKRSTQPCAVFHQSIADSSFDIPVPPKPKPQLTRKTRAQRNEGDGGDRVREANRASEVRGQVPDDHGQDTDHDDANRETQPAPHVICRARRGL